MKTACLLTLVAFTAALTGCSNSSLTPELRGLSMRPADNDNARDITLNQNVRMITDDIDRLWLLDHPSRLSPYPVTDTLGQPR